MERNAGCRHLLLLAWLVVLGGEQALAQQQAPDMILFNGKIVTVDNHEVNANVGTIAQALAVKGDKIVAVGTNAQIQALAGSNTRRLDLKGRTVIPGMAGTHDHPMDWDLLNPLIVKKVITDDMHIERFLNDPPDQQIQSFPRILDEAVRKVKPGQWIRISMLYGKDYRWGDQIEGFMGRQITKQMLDMAAPNNPVVVRTGFVGIMLNQRGIEEVKKFYGDNWKSVLRGSTLKLLETGIGGTDYRWVEQDVMFPNKQLQEIYRLGMSWMAGYGMTVNASGLYTAGAIHAYHALDDVGQMSMRFPWTWYYPARVDFFDDPYFLEGIVSRIGKGSDYLWMIGALPGDNGAACSTLPGTSPEVKKRDSSCNYERDSVSYKGLYKYIRAGGRFTGAHTGGDKDVDLIMDTIEQASKDAGMTIDQIRAKRHAYDHLAMSPRPDQIVRIKNLGMIPGGWDLYIYEGSGAKILNDYGEQAVQWIVPRKSIFDAGVRESVEIDRAIGYTNLTFFNVLYSGITRKDKDGNIVAPQQRVSREAMLKSATLWGAYYAEGEDRLGSLEVGKFADLAVLDRDYMTVPVDDIQNIHVLMTLLGGKVVHLVPSLAREVGMQPAGAQVTLGGQASQW